MAQQDFGLRAHARAHLDEPPAPAKRQPIVNRGLQEARLPMQPLALGLAVPMEIAGLAHDRSLAQLRASFS